MISRSAGLNTPKVARPRVTETPSKPTSAFPSPFLPVPLCPALSCVQHPAYNSGLSSGSGLGLSFSSSLMVARHSSFRFPEAAAIWSKSCCFNLVLSAAVPVLAAAVACCCSAVLALTRLGRRRRRRSALLGAQDLATSTLKFDHVSVHLQLVLAELDRLPSVLLTPNPLRLFAIAPSTVDDVALRAAIAAHSCCVGRGRRVPNAMKLR
ncbi:hypothetical protein Mapa_007575 [Marchantia paleacea]|nr:hypothetical protein Mapa_007575 [Marchantia paleacea]